jgi:hypothetical protein
MAKINSRTKGKTAERELIGELKKLLPEDMTIDLSRNLDQTRSGGHDILGLDGWAIEVKRYAQVLPGDIERFWAQAVDQAGRCQQAPVLCYRADRRDWRVVMRASDLMSAEHDNLYAHTVEMSMPLFARIVTEAVNV